MQFSVAAVLAFAASALAQTAGFDPITKPGQSETIPAGQSFEIDWQTSSAYTGSVTLALLGGSSPATLQVVSTIATGVDNTLGAYTWSVDSSLGSLATYGIRISLDSDPTIFQYSFPFAISASQGSSSSSSSSTSASATGSSSSSSSSSSFSAASNGTVTATSVNTITTTVCTTSTPAGNWSAPATSQPSKVTLTSYFIPSGSAVASKTSAPTPVVTSGATSVVAGPLAMLGAFAAAMLAL